MSRSSDLLDQIKERSNLVDVISQIVTLKKTGKGYIGLCPFHKEKTPSFHVYQQPDRFYCFGCQEHGDIFSFTQRYYNLSFPEAVKRLAHDFGLEAMIQYPSIQETSLHSAIKQVLGLTRDYFIDSLQALPEKHLAKVMLQARKIKPEIAKLFEIGWAGYHAESLLRLWPDQKQSLVAAGLITDNHLGQSKDRFINRLIFPIYSTKSNIVGFGGRIVDIHSDKKYPKYLNSPETELFKKNSLLYGLNLALTHHQFKSFIIVEGYFDVLQLFNHNLPCAVAPMGTALSEMHFELLLKYRRELIFCFDGDMAGQHAAFKVLTMLLPHYNHQVSISFVTLPSSEDPDSFLLKNGRESFIQLCKNRVKIGEYLFQKLESLYPLDQIDNKIKFVAEAKNLISLIQDPDARLTLFAVLRSLNIGARGNLAQRKPEKIVLSKVKAIDLLAAIFAKNPLLRDELDEKYKNILKEQQEHQELRALLTLPLESEEFKKNQRLILIKHGKLVDILPQDGLKMELEQQLKEMGIFQ